MSTLSGYGIAATLPTGWEGRIRRLPVAAAPNPRAGAAAPDITGAVSRPFVHLANIAIPGELDSFGGSIVERLGPQNAMIALIEYSPESVGTPLFARSGIPRSLSVRQFDRHALQRILPGQAGHQTFCTESGRAFCLYVVVGSSARLGSTIHHLNKVLKSLRVATIGAMS